MYVPGSSDAVEAGEATGPPPSPPPCSSLCELCAQWEEVLETDRGPVSSPVSLATAAATFGEVDSEWQCLAMCWVRTNLFMCTYVCAYKHTFVHVHMYAVMRGQGLLARMFAYLCTYVRTYYIRV